MLKRQRQASPPPPSSSNIPLITAPAGDAIAERIFKKQRTAPPSLDGRIRGWGQEPELPGEDDDGEDYIDDDIEDMVPLPSTAGYVHPSLHAENEYKSANTVLRELHTLHQHRMLFSTPPSSGSHSIAHLMVAHTSPPLLHGPSPLRNQIGKDRITGAWSPHSSSTAKEKSSEKDESVLEEEAHRVAERYEGLNKFVRI